MACAKAGLATPNNNYNLDRLPKPILRPGRVLLCGGRMDARGLKATEIAEGAARSSLTELTLAAGKVIVSEERVMPESTLTLGAGHRRRGRGERAAEAAPARASHHRRDLPMAIRPPSLPVRRTRDIQSSGEETDRQGPREDERTDPVRAARRVFDAVRGIAATFSELLQSACARHTTAREEHEADPEAPLPRAGLDAQASLFELLAAR